MTDYTKDSSIDPTRMEQWTMASKLPYTLTSGVTATREGLEFASPLMVTVEYFPYDIASLDEPLTIPWPDARERLQYREGEPWCFYDERNNGLICNTTTPAYHGTPSYLNRLATILCDDAEGFRVLHWCVTEFGGNHV